jgi:AcrR family transcriptional regulator
MRPYMETATTRRRPRTNRERVEESSLRLVNAAVELIAEKGFERTTAAEIGERAGYSRNMVRDRYGSKEALLESLMDQELGSRLLPDLRTERIGSGLDLVLGALDDLLTAVEGEPEIMRAVLVLSFEAPGPAPAARTRMIEIIRGFEAEMLENIQTGKADGSIRPEVDSSYEAQHYVSYGIGLCYRWVLSRDEFDLPAAIRDWRRRLEQTLAS